MATDLSEKAGGTQFEIIVNQVIISTTAYLQTQLLSPQDHLETLLLSPHDYHYHHQSSLLSNSFFFLEGRSHVYWMNLNAR